MSRLATTRLAGYGLRMHSTVSSGEIEHFNRLAAKWWDPTGELKLLHRMNAPRVDFLRQTLLEERELPPTRWLEGKRVLDVGCGAGIFSEVSPSLVHDSWKFGSNGAADRHSRGSERRRRALTQQQRTCGQQRRTPRSTTSSRERFRTLTRPPNSSSRTARRSTSCAPWRSSSTSTSRGPSSTL